MSVLPVRRMVTRRRLGLRLGRLRRRLRNQSLIKELQRGEC